MSAFTFRRGRSLIAAIASVGLAGCAGFSPDAGLGDIARSAQPHLPAQASVVWARTPEQRGELDRRVAELLAAPLGADAAVQVALFNNRELQAAFFQLGVSEADLVQAGRLPNPGFSFGRSVRGDEREIERSLHLDLARLLAWPLVGRLERARFERTQADTLRQVLGLAADTRRAWVNAVAAAQTLQYAMQVRDAAQAGAELARRMGAAGNWNALNQAREQGFAADAALGVARATRAQVAARERLTRLMGLWGEQTRFTLPDRLPDLPAEAPEQPDIEQRAMQTRLDLRAARLDIEALARHLGLSRTTRFINVFELGLSRNSSNEAPTQRGWEISVELPLFDWGDARVAKAEALYMQGVQRTAQTAINARSEVRETYLGYRSAFDIARWQRDEVVPLKKRISDENLLRYNGMLIGVFELLADARSQIVAVNASIEALRDFWLAEADLRSVMVGSPGAGSMAVPTLGTDTSGAADAAH
jgi:outer membrane protein TolC